MIRTPELFHRFIASPFLGWKFAGAGNQRVFEAIAEKYRKFGGDAAMGDVLLRAITARVTENVVHPLLVEFLERAGVCPRFHDLLDKIVFDLADGITRDFEVARDAMEYLMAVFDCRPAEAREAYGQITKEAIRARIQKEFPGETMQLSQPAE
jgi:hypothetical protein